MTERLSRVRAAHIGVALLIIIVVALVFAPDIQYGAGRANLTTYSAGPYGVRGLYQTLDRLGWEVIQRRARFQGKEATDVTILLLDPPIPPGPRETAVLLDAVRRGARLLAVPTHGTALADSLGIRVAPGYAFNATATGSADAGITFDGTFEHWLAPGSRTGQLPPEAEELLTVTRRPQPRPGILGLPFGEGRIVLVADPSVFSNERVRLLDEAVLAVRLIEWLEGAGGRRPLVFSEWHHGRGVHPNPMGVFWEALFRTAPGRVLLILLLAGGALLVAVSARPVAPLPPARIERRSPFEHVDALSRAYQQIGGTRIVTRHLVRGLWRRRAAGMRMPAGEREYLSSLRERFPVLSPQVELLLGGLDRRLPPAEFVKVGEAIHTIERTLTQ